MHESSTWCPPRDYILWLWPARPLFFFAPPFHTTHPRSIDSNSLHSVPVHSEGIPHTWYQRIPPFPQFQFFIMVSRDPTIHDHLRPRSPLEDHTMDSHPSAFLFAIARITKAGNARRCRCHVLFYRSFDWLAEQPLLCPSLSTIAFFNCNFNPGVMEELEGVVAKRKELELACLYQVVIVSSTGVLPDYTLIQRLRQHVPRVDVRVDDALPDLS